MLYKPCVSSKTPCHLASLAAASLPISSSRRSSTRNSAAVGDHPVRARACTSASSAARVSARACASRTRASVAASLSCHFKPSLYAASSAMRSKLRWCSAVSRAHRSTASLWARWTVASAMSVASALLCDAAASDRASASCCCCSMRSWGGLACSRAISSLAAPSCCLKLAASSRAAMYLCWSSCLPPLAPSSYSVDARTAPCCCCCCCWILAAASRSS
mmetsp:Transcript_2683/g.6227  ORF Transcript_2683/g.6227 Transcript_2683/m.6227 type:complete len:219 (-) Transcript_2683:708-1364(-)